MDNTKVNVSLVDLQIMLKFLARVKMNGNEAMEFATSVTRVRMQMNQSQVLPKLEPKNQSTSQEANENADQKLIETNKKEKT